MSNLTAAQLTALTSGQPVRQVWSIRTPVLSDHSAYSTTVIDEGIFSATTTRLSRVTNPGKRRHIVWNPHPKITNRPEAVRYSIEVANGDGMFHRRSGSVWNPFGVYDADPGECFLLHNIYVWDAVSRAWSPISHMDFVGQVLTVEYAGGASMNETETTPGNTKPTVAPHTAVITSEQIGAWATLRRVFTKDDAVDEQVDSVALGAAQFTAS